MRCFLIPWRLLKMPGRRDVYKRQAQVLIREADPDADASAQAAKLLRSEYGRAAIAAYVQGWLGAVSYTHLDVYKRQVSPFATDSNF